MKKRLPMILISALILVLTLCLILSYLLPARVPAAPVTVSEIMKHGNVVLSVKGSEFLDMGYACGDVVTVGINGRALDMPVGSGYTDVEQGQMICRVEIKPDEGEDRVILAVNMGDFATAVQLAEKETIEAEPGYVWRFKAVEPVTVSFAMKEKGGYYDQWVLHQLSRSKNRVDYPALSDAEFANFRAVATSGMGEGRLYRSSSPFNPEDERNREADAAAAAAGIRTVVDLADSEERMRSYEGAADSYCAGQKLICLDLDMDFASAAFEEGLARGLRFLAANEAPYLLHCNLGKDRAGFAAAVLEALMGASAEEIVADYMLSYYNFNGVLPGTEQYDVIASSNIQKTVSAAFGLSSLEDGGLQEAARSYLSRIGLSEGEIASLQAALAGTGA